jgi:predicted outer membrane protein
MKVHLAAMVSLVMLPSVAQAQRSTTNREAQPGQPATLQQNERQQNDQQQAGRPGAQSQTDRRGGSQATDLDQLFAQMLAIDNAAEIQVSQAAAERLQDPQIKQFADQMVQEHQQMLAELAKFGAQEVQLRGAGNRRIGDDTRIPTATNTESGGRARQSGDQTRQRESQVANTANDSSQGRTRENQNRGQESRDETAAGGTAMHHFLRVKQEIAEQCIQSAKEELAAKSGDEADRCYIAAQVFDHQKMLDALTVLQRHASPEFGQALTKATQTTQQHLEHAKQLLQTFEGQGAATGDRPGSESSPSRQPGNQ